jgi:predicted Zn-dependent peptidase
MVREAFETELLLAILFGKSGPVFMRLYERGLIDESFSASYISDRGVGYTAIGGDTDSPGTLLKECLKAIKRVRNRGISKRDYMRTRRRILGGYLRRFNSLEAAAVRALTGRFLRYNPFNILDMAESITLEDINRRARAHLREKAMSVCSVLPH